MEWIKVTDRLPTEEDATPKGNILAANGSQVGYINWKYANPINITHWMPLPNPPTE